MILNQPTRLEELEHKFNELESQLEDSPEKQALSILHAMIHETRRLPSWNAGTPTAERDNGGASGGSSRMTLEHVANLYKSAPKIEGDAENAGLPVGTPAPDFTLRDANDRPVSLSDFRGKNVVLVFYPLDWSPACSDQLSLYQSELEEFEKYNAQVIGVSVDSIYSHGAWAAVRGITFPLLADFHPKGEVARQYNVMRQSDGFSERALYVIDGDGIIRYTHVSPQLHKIPDIYELFEQLQRMNEREPVLG
jgi:peroxiredoxin